MIREQVHYLFLWVVSAVMAAFAARHVEEDKKADDGNEEHAAGHGGHDKDKKVFFLTLAAAMRGHKDLMEQGISIGMRIMLRQGKQFKKKLLKQAPSYMIQAPQAKRK